MDYIEIAEESLNTIDSMQKKIRSEKLELEALRYKASGAGAIRYDKEKVMTSPSGDLMAMVVDDIIKQEQKIKEDEELLEQEKKEAYEVIRLIENIDHRTFIEWIYINNATMRSTAKKMYVSERRIYDLKKEALNSYGFALNKKLHTMA